MIEIREASRYRHLDEYARIDNTNSNYVVLEDNVILAIFKESENAIRFAYTLLKVKN